MTSDSTSISARVNEPVVAGGEAVRTRILRQARGHFFAVGYSGFVMADFAAELGMSKKTLYVHFPGKDALIQAVIAGFAAEVRADAERILGDRRLRFAEKLRGFAQGMMDRLACVRPGLMKDLQRASPSLFAEIQRIRAENLPYILGRIIEEGKMAGEVRDDIKPSLVAQIYLQAIQGMLNDDVLRRLGIGPHQAFEQVIRVFFGGLLTPKGQADYEKLFPPAAVV